MKANCWEGRCDVRVEDVPDPAILNPRDMIIRVTHTTVCGSDLHLYDGYVPTMKKGDILGHEPVGEVVEVGPAVRNHRVGERVVVSAVVACGQCEYCQRGEFSLCDNSNPNAWLQEKMYTYGTAGIFGYSHLFGGYPGGQAEYLRVPYADVGAFTLPDEVTSEQAVLLADVFPTGFMGADLCNLRGGETVAVWGCGPVGLFVMKSAALLGAGRIIAIDYVPYRLEVARRECGAEVLNFMDCDADEALREMTGGRGPDACVDAVGMESHGPTALLHAYDRVKQAVRLETDRGHVPRQMIQACRKGGTVVIMGVYAMFVDKFPLGVAFNKALQFRMGQLYAQKYIPRLMEYIREGRIDPTFCLTNRYRLDEIPQAYETFKHHEENCIKTLIKVA